jgi:hypothetical protein
MVEKSAWTNQVSESEIQGSIAAQDVESQYKQSVTTVESQAAEAIQKAKSEAEASRVKLRNSISTAEVDIQSTLNAAREARKKAEHRQAIGMGVQVVKMPDISKLVAYQEDLIRLRGEVDRAEGKQLDDINKQIAAIKSDLQKQRGSAIERIGKIIGSNIASINQSYQKAQTQEKEQEQAQLIQQASSMQASAIRLNTGEYIDNQVFNDMSLAQQNYIMANGIDKYNVRMKEALSHVAVTQPEAVQAVQSTPEADLWTQKLPTSQYDEMTTPLEPTPEQSFVLGVPYVAPKSILTSMPSYPQGTLFPVSKPSAKTYDFKEMLTIDQKKQLSTMAATGLAVTLVPEAGGIDIPIEAVITGAILAGATGLAVYKNKEALLHNIGVLGNMVADKQTEWQSFSNGVWVDSNNQVRGFDERTKIWIETVLQPWFEKNIAPKVDMSIKGIPLQQTINEIEGVIKADPIPVPKGVTLDMPRIEDFIYINPSPQAKKAADDVLMAVAGVGSVLYDGVSSAYSAIKGMDINKAQMDAMFAAINKILADTRQGNIVAAQKSLTDVANSLDAVQREAGSQVDILTRHATAAMDEARTKLAILEEATRSYVASLNPTPVQNTRLNEKTAAIVAGHQLAVIAAQARNEPEISVKTNTEMEIDPYIGKVIMDNYTAFDTNVKTQNKPITTAHAMAKAIVGIVTEVFAATGVDTGTSTQVEVQRMAQTVARVLPKTLTQTQTQTAVQTAVDTLTKTAVRTAAQARTAVREAEATRTAELTLTNTLTVPKIILPLPDGKTAELTPEQFNGIVAWKQGFIYIMKYRKNGEVKTIYSRKPIQGVRYADGIGSVQESIVLKGGNLDRDMKFDMGFEDVVISATKQGEQPHIDFDLDQLTEKQRKGMAAWKQGFNYVLKYPDKNGKYVTKNSRTPIKGVKYADGVGSAVKSFITKNGDIPHDLKFEMGIQDVTIFANKPRGEMLDFNLKKEYRKKLTHKKDQNNSASIRTVR